MLRKVNKAKIITKKMKIVSKVINLVRKTVKKILQIIEFYLKKKIRTNLKKFTLVEVVFMKKIFMKELKIWGLILCLKLFIFKNLKI